LEYGLDVNLSLAMFGEGVHCVEVAGELTI